ncbi:MAG: hypothetical protein Q9160_002596 [Pyrenula sp. 1 TL-2023]
MDPCNSVIFRTLLLLSAPPSPTSPSSLDAAYRPALEHFLAKRTECNRVDIALVVPPPDRTFSKAQSLLASVYQFICAIAAKYSVDLDLPGGIDFRIYLVVESGARKNEGTSETAQVRFRLGPAVDLKTLAERSLQYERIFSLENEKGEGLLQQVVAPMSSRSGRIPHIERLPGGMSFSIAAHEIPSSHRSQITHSSVAVGGTFDHLHVGHKLLLTATALALGPSQGTSAKLHLTIGITGDELLVNKKHAAFVESWDVRQQRVAEFLEYIMIFPTIAAVERQEERVEEPGPNGRRVIAKLGSDIEIHYVQISDPFGPTITDESISALVVSKETAAGGKAVNDKRQEKEWSSLEIFEVDVLDAVAAEGVLPSEVQSNFQAKVSSTQIRSRLQGGNG